MQRLPLGMLLMYGAGLISALLGIGSGVLKIPAMDTALRLPIKVSSATSNFMIGVTAAASAGAYFMRGDIVPAIAGPVALGSVVGSLIGARILMAVSNERIRLLFVVVLVVLALQMALSGFGAINTIGLTADGPLFGPPGIEVNLLYITGLLRHPAGAGPFSIDRLPARRKREPAASPS